MQPLNVHEYEALAQERLESLNPAAWHYYQGGSDDEATLRDNRAAFARLRLRPRVLVDVSTIETDTTTLGAPISMPICVAPTAQHGFAHANGECITAAGASASGTLMVASSSSSRRLEDIAESCDGPLWFQLYIRSFQQARSFVRRAELSGYKAIVLTVDSPRLGNRERDKRYNLAAIPFIEGNFGDEELEFMGNTITWQTLDWLRTITSLPLVIKGILTGEDALLAVEHGAAGIIVSNHGGRQLDGAPATIEALPEVVEAVDGRCEVYLDGGIRRGTDVLKALAFGARAVFVGRPVLYGLIVDGQEGVRHVLDILRAELETAMALCGRPTLASIDRTLFA
jgi:isopentenyl diphosphate isomerase/L-lactate dehydrogenase-like FMN-dependent dehydrogenase